MSEHSLPTLPTVQITRNTQIQQSIFGCKCHNKRCVYELSDEEDGESIDFSEFPIQQIESTLSIDSSVVLDILQTQCHCVYLPSGDQYRLQYR